MFGISMHQQTLSAHSLEERVHIILFRNMHAPMPVHYNLRTHICICASAQEGFLESYPLCRDGKLVYGDDF